MTNDDWFSFIQQNSYDFSIWIWFNISIWLIIIEYRLILRSPLFPFFQNVMQNNLDSFFGHANIITHLHYCDISNYAILSWLYNHPHIFNIRMELVFFFYYESKIGLGRFVIGLSMILDHNLFYFVFCSFLDDTISVKTYWKNSKNYEKNMQSIGICKRVKFLRIISGAQMLP